MAFTRKMLKALGIDDEKIDQIMDAHTEVTDALKADRDKYKGDAEKLEDVQKELDTLKANGDDSYKEKYEAEKKAHEKLKADIENEKAHSKKETAYRELLKAAGVKDKFVDTIIRADKTVIDGLELGEDGKIDGADTLTEDAKKNWSDFIVKSGRRQPGVENPPGNNGGSSKTKEQIMAIKDPIVRQAEIAKNPGLFGIKISE